MAVDQTIQRVQDALKLSKLRSKLPKNPKVIDIRVEDYLIAGLGDSVAAGEGNPDRPVALADEGFCFRRFLGSGLNEYFRPSRAGYKGNKACDDAPTMVPWE